jgi:mRNA interferase YafQ
MRTIERTNQFKRDYKRELKGRFGASLDEEFGRLLMALAQDDVLDLRYRDHALTGGWKDFRDCHVRPDLVLIYRRPDNETLRLVRLGSHSELGF